MGFPRIGRVFRGSLRLSLAAVLGVLIAWPLRAFLTSAPAPVEVQTSADASSKPEADDASAPATPSRSSKPPVESPPYPTGYAVLGRKVIVQMSDGTTRIERDAQLSSIERNSVTINGEKLFIKPKPRLEGYVIPPDYIEGRYAGAAGSVDASGGAAVVVKSQ